MKKQITIKDLAKILNIHNATVSRALRNHPDIKPETKEKVLALAKKLNYYPNIIAQSLKTQKTNTIGVVVPDISNPFYAAIIHSIIETASRYNYQTILTVSLEDNKREEENIKTLISKRVEGIMVCMTLNTVNTKIFERVKNSQIPIVFYDRVPNSDKFNSVTINNRIEAYKAIDFVIRSGHKKIAHLAGPGNVTSAQERALGYKDALKKHQIHFDQNLIIEGCFRKEDGYRGFKTFLNKGLLPEVIFTYDAIVAQGVYKAAKEENISIPTDIGVIGFGNKDLATLLSPPLTYIKQDPAKIGIKVFELLRSEIENTNISKPQKIIMPVSLEINGSLLTEEKIESLDNSSSVEQNEQYLIN